MDIHSNVYYPIHAETFLYVCGNSAILLDNIHSIYGKSTFVHFSEVSGSSCSRKDYSKSNNKVLQLKEEASSLRTKSYLSSILNITAVDESTLVLCFSFMPDQPVPGATSKGLPSLAFTSVEPSRSN